MDAHTPRADAHQWLDLSAAQRAVWLDLQLAAAPLGYQLGGWARIDAGIDVDIARQAVSLMMARHDALRLRIDSRQPRQRLDASVTPPLVVTDLAQAADPDAAFRAFAAHAFATALPLGEAPLFCVDLVQAGARRSYVLWRCHHLITDASSVAIALRLWQQAYQALAGEADGELAPASSFVASLAADAAYAASPQARADLAYWRTRLADPPGPLFTQLPAPGPALPPQHWHLAGAAYQAFAAACRGCGVTTQRGLLALLAVLLARRHDRRDVALGLALHRRDFATRDVVGMLAGLLPVRCAVAPDASLGEAVQAIGAALDRDFRHQRIALDALGRALGSGGPLFDVVISHLLDDTQAAGSGELYRGPEMTPLALYAVERPRAGRIDFELACRPDFVDAAMCARLATALRQTIAAFVADPFTIVDDFCPLDAAERVAVVETWNATEMPFATAPLPALFAAQAARTPDAAAVADGERTLSYAALDAVSDALAAALQARGVGREGVVGVALHRSLESVVALLAILKAGGVYLPLDPAYPAARVAFMLRDAAAALVLCDAATGALLPADMARLTLQDVPAARPRPVALSGANLAYIVYTSGSTGTPKGVSVSHASAANLAFARNAGHDPIGPGDRVLAAISVGFDVSIGQLLLPLLAGACVVIAPDLRTLSAVEFWALLAAQRVSQVNSVPSFFASVLDAAPTHDTLALRRLMLGGEALDGALCRRLAAALPGLQVVNMYGPTEACIDATAHPVPEGVGEGLLPIGRPLANYRAYVLDARLRPVPPGVAGALYLGGPGLARGYVGQPGLTAARFVADPFGPPGGRLYCTGDRASWRGDGSLAFHGRADDQIKIRGFRVEPGEIEAALRGHPAVAQAAVIARQDAGGMRLVAYVVAAAGMPELAELRAYLAERLPAHMVPAAFVALPDIPLTTNGKLDRAALPAPAADAAAHVAPATPLEAQLAGIFARLLDVATVGATDDFFALGGHSLLATRLVSQVRADCGVDLPLRTVFASPTVAALAAVIAAQSGTPALPPLVPAARPAELPLSFGQQRLWFLDQLDPDAQSYVIAAALELTGALDADALAEALARVVARHESLRTRFAARDGRAIQVIDATATVALERLDLAAQDAGAQDATVAASIAAAERTRFRLAEGNLLRARLLRLAPQRHVLVLAVHHIVSDGWSMGVLLRELTALYAGRTLPKLAVQYADYALWQRDWLAGDVLEGHLAHWRAALAGAPAYLDLPLDRPRPPVPSLRGALAPWRCPPALLARLQTRAREAGVTLFMLLLTAFQATLARWSGVRDIVVGTPIAQRTRAETEPLIGFFVNTLALRADCAGQRRFADLLAQARETTLAAYAHQDLPFEKLVEALQPDRDLGRQPVVQVMFVLQNMPMPAVDLAGLRLQPLDLPVTVAKFDLTLVLTETREGLVGGFEYATDLFDAATIARVGSWFGRLLTAVAEDPALRLDDFSPLDAAERVAVVETWNATEMPFATAPLPALFAAQAARTPDAAAVADGERTLSYAALDAASDALAAALQARGVGREGVVGVALHRSLESVVALLAILKAGGVYLPLDPAYPAARVAFMLRDAAAALVLCDAATGALLPADMARLTLQDVPAARPRPVALSGANLAYIVYTSGSTGTPKGVSVSHASAANLAFARNAGHDPIGPGDRVLAAISVGFDVSIGQLLLPLLAGACVVIAPDLRTLSAVEFWALLAAQRVSQVNSVPSFFASVLDAAPTHDTLALRRLMLGGEALDGALCRRLAAALPGLQVVNMYGPTEACIDATAHPVPEGVGEGLLPIGRPLANYRAYVLDARLRPVPPGVAGALYLGGPGLARGYVGQPGLTAARFVADPFGPPGGRLYCTGDRASWRGDGSLAFHGRADDQIKIRGFRVEPGEIEAALRGHPAVAQAAVIARQDAGGMRLVAYVVAAAGMPELAELRAYLAERLPAHMVPAAFVALPDIPLTTNGKLDRAALPAPAAAAEVAAPVGARETLLCALFAELTGAAAVGRDDGFFELGGDSIGAIRLVSLARSRGGLAMQVRDVFAHPSPAALSLVATEAAAAAAPAWPDSGPLLPTPLQHALLAARAPIGRFHQAVALHPPAGLGPDRLAAALDRLVREHPALRLQFSADGSLAVAETAPAPHLQRIAQADLSEYVVALSADFARSAVAALWADADGALPAVVVLAIHHFAVDGVSWRILLEDLAMLCAGDDPATAALPPPSLPFRAWTRHLHAQAVPRRAELPLWQQMLAPPAPLRTDRPAVPGANTIGAARTLSLTLPDAATARLLAAPAVYRAEINDLLLAALGLALAAWHGGGQATHVVAVEGHGRETGDDDLDLGRTVGWFTSVFPLRLDMAGLDLAEALAGGAAAGEAIKRVKTALRRLPDHGLGYGLLRHLDPASGAALAALPEPALLFNYLGRFAHAAATGAENWRPAPLPAAPLDDAGRSRDPVILEANALLDGQGALHVAWTFAPDCFDAATVADLGERFLAALDALGRHCTQTPLPPPARLIPADFPQAAGLDAALLAALADAVPDLEAVLPLTPLQQGLAFETLVRGPGTADPYHVQGILRLAGAIDPDALRTAWLQLTGRHAVLRLALPQCGLAAGLGVLRPAAAALDWRVLDWRAAEDATAERDLAALLDRDRAHGFDLAAGRLFRMTLIRRGGGQTWLVTSNHHALLDGWSMPVLVGELLRLCQGAKLPPTLPWQAYLAWLAAADRDQAAAFWAERHRGVAETAGTLLLPPPDTAAGGMLEAVEQVTPAVSTALERVARRHGLTLATVALGAWALLLKPLQAMPGPDLVLGVTSGGRPAALAGSDQAVGLFIQTLPLRVPMDPATGLPAWLHALQTALREQEAHGWLGLPAIRQAAGLAGDRPPFMALFVFENYPADPAASRADAPIRLLGAEGRDATHYPLALAVLPGADGLRLRLNFDGRLIGAGDARALLQRLQALLRHLADDPAVPLGELPALDAAERVAVVETWNATEMPFATAPLPALFAAQAARTPDAAAVADGERTLSYAALDAVSDALAAALQARGVGREGVVGVALHRSLESVVALLAILKAGGVYLPLDPAYPAARVAFMLRDAAAALVLCDAATGALLPADMARLTLQDVPAARPRPVALSGANLAYIVYTSGSTGTPKGVSVSHASAANLAFARNAGHDPIGPGDRVLAAISVGFDVSIGQLLLPLLAGACVVIAPDLRTLSAVEFWALLAAQRVSQVNSVPSFFASVLDAAPTHDTLALRRLMLGGEALDGALCRRLAAALPGLQVVNMYGPTEACIDATAHPVPEGVGEGLLPIGRPLANYRAYVLDARLRPVPPGVAGALYLGGPGLARGYVGQPGLTAARFVADPFGPPGGRLYCTGDRASWRGDGSLAFHGRADDQIKIRGFRVEPGEIEAALRGHPAVAQAAVIARQDAGGMRLVAYVVAAAGMPELAELRAYLAERLPAHMVPAAFVALPDIPLTTNGKLDRAALPAPAADAPRAQAPRDAVEFAVQALWQDVLGVADVGLHDDFFEIGGNSLLAIRLIGACSAAFAVTLPVSTIFVHRTVEAMAAALRQDRCPSTRSTRLVTLRGGAAGGPLVCIHPQGGTVFCYAPLVRLLPAGLPVLGLQAAGLDAAETLPASLAEMAADYVAALRAVQPAGPYRLLGYSFGGLAAFEMARHLHAAGEAVTLALLDAPRLDRGPGRSSGNAAVLAMLAADIGLPPDTPPPSSTADLFAAATAAGLVPPDFSQAQAERVVAVYVNNAAIADRYRPAGPLPIPLLQVRAIRRDGPLPDWTDLVTGEAATCDLDCTHRDLITADIAPQLAAAVAGALCHQETPHG